VSLGSAQTIKHNAPTTEINQYLRKASSAGLLSLSGHVIASNILWMVYFSQKQKCLM